MNPKYKRNQEIKVEFRVVKVEDIDVERVNSDFNIEMEEVIHA